MSELPELTEEATRILDFVRRNPYVPEQTLEDELDLERDTLSAGLKELTDHDVVITMKRQSGSSHESRVAENVYLVNPDRADDLP